MKKNGRSEEREESPELALAVAEHQAAVEKFGTQIERLRWEEPTPVDVPTLPLIRAVKEVILAHGSGHCDACRRLAALIQS